MKRMALAQPCPCGGAAAAVTPAGRTPAKKVAPVLAYSQCCGRWLEADLEKGPFAPDARQLMCSRYTAFVLEREAYLRATWHASQRPAHIAFEPGVKWLGLEVRDFQASDPGAAEVEFVARQKPLSGPATRLHERSRFVREGGRWLYVDGVQR